MKPHPFKLPIRIEDFNTLEEAQLFAADIASKHVWPLYNFTRG